MIDSTLIIALLSDYAPLLSCHLSEIRDQLGVLEATLVPDNISSDTNDSLLSTTESSTSEQLSRGDEDLTVNKLERMALNDPPPFSSVVPSDPKDHLDPLSSSSGLSRSTSASETRTSSTTSPTSLVDSEGGLDDDVELLRSLFPTV